MDSLTVFKNILPFQHKHDKLAKTMSAETNESKFFKLVLTKNHKMAMKSFTKNSDVPLLA